MSNSRPDPGRIAKLNSSHVGENMEQEVEGRGDGYFFLFILMIIVFFNAFSYVKWGMQQFISQDSRVLEEEARKLFKGTGPGLLFYQIPSDFETNRVLTPVLLDLNTATEEELELIPGIGPKMALEILQARNEMGFFLSREELLWPYGPVLPTVFEVLKEYAH